MRRKRALLLVPIVAGLGALLAPAARGASPPPPPAEPTIGPLLSGTSSLVAGTHVWTDYVYDDLGTDPTTAPSSTGNLADLVQLQVTPGTSTLRLRAVLQTLLDPDVPALGVGLDLDGNPQTGAPGVPGGRWEVTGTPLGLERFVLVGDGRRDVLAWSGRWEDIGDATAAVDVVANTMTVAVPNTLLGGVGSTWRVAGLVGLADASRPAEDGVGNVHDLAYVRDTGSANWQSTVQANVLTGAEDAARAMAVLDVRRARAGVTELTPPVPGAKNTLLYRSRLELGEGIGTVENRKYAGPYQPYVAWFPAAGLPARPPLVVFLHGAMGNHLGGSYGDDGAFVEAGPVGIGPGIIDPAAVVITPLGRGETPLAYEGPAEQDILDVIADATRRFGVDEDRVVLTGYSLGGVGTFRMAQLHPDRWAGAVEIVGAHDLGALTVQEEAGGTQTLPNQLENLRNLPFRLAHARLDELELLIGGVQPDKAALELHQLGYDYKYWQFHRREHLAFPVDTIQCELELAIARGRVRDPARVTYSQEPAIPSSDPTTGLDVRHDRAYWMSDMVVRGETFRPGDKGTVDVVNLARADRTPKATAVADANQNVTSGRDVCGPNERVATADVWTMTGQVLSPGAPELVDNAVSATLTRVVSVRLDLARMRGLDLRRPLRVDTTSDGVARLRLGAPWPGAVLVERADRPQERLCPRDGVLDLIVGAGTTSAWLTPTAARCG